MIDNLRRRTRNYALPIEDFEWNLAVEENGAITDRMDAETAITLLKPQQREIVRSLSIDGAGVKETADRLGMTEGAVRVTLHRALKFLAGHYGEK
jgi:RNA polymerase sigma-70 factor (ECF subfamily)